MTADNAPETTDNTPETEEKPAPQPRAKQKYAALLVIGSLICIAGSVFYILQQTKEERDEQGMTKTERALRDQENAAKEREKMLASFNTTDQRRQTLFEGLENPAWVPPAEADVDDTTRVVGIAEGAEARAYALTAMSYTNSHIIHDSHGKTPISITYCDTSDTARVFRRTVEPAKFQMVGIEGQNMELVIDGKHYAQTSKEIPLEEFKDFTLCTWGEWKARHPQTKLYARRKAAE